MDRAAPSNEADASPALPGPRTLHIYRRFHPDYTGDGIYYSRLLPLVAAEGGGGGEFLAYETDPPGPGDPPPPSGAHVRYLATEGLPAASVGLARFVWRHRGRFDVVHLHSHVDRYFLSYLLARALGMRVLFSCTLDDSPTQLLRFYRPLFRPLARLLMRGIGTFVVISPHLLRLSLETVAPDRLRFIPQGTELGAEPASPDEATRRSRRRELGLPEDAFLLLNVGSVSRRKNLVFLVDALALVPEADAHLVLVGPELEEDYAAELRERMRVRGLEGRVTFAGFRNDAGHFYEVADCFVFASTSEGFPNVFLESMARGLPIVSRFLPGLTDYVIEHGRTGLLADGAAEFATALRTLRADPGRRLAMGRAARRFAERNLGFPAVARRYAELYREGEGRREIPAAREAAAARDFPDLRIAFAGASAPGPAALGLREFDTPGLAQPLLQVVIDTEADFDWDKGIWTDTGQTASIIGLREHAGVFLRHGARPTLVLDHPVTMDAQARGILRELAAEGCELGVHLHTWTTPPLVEPRDDWHSFSGNLGPWLERSKLEGLTERVAELAGTRPRIFKGGRYGLGGNTVATLRELGFEADLSISPAFDYSHLGGPDFTRFTARPGWYGAPGGLLSLPTTSGYLGWARGQAGRLAPLMRRPLPRRLRAPRLAALSEALYPARLSPEGMGFAGMRRLARTLLADGLRVFTLSLHSPSLLPGNTPYARNQAELDRLVADTDRFLACFRDELGGRFVTTSEMRAALLGGS